jgi:photosystem II stability/assembly factor-like uncharacterized protein
MSAILMLILYFAPARPQWSVQTSGLDTNLRGVSVKCDKKQSCVIWASGSNGVILRSTNRGKSWKQVSVTGAADLDFRDIGDGDKSRIYKTTDGGSNWKLQYSDKRPSFFLDSMACDSMSHCVAVSDPVEGKFPVLATDDGELWKELPRDNMPAALSQEGAFAASGTAITLCEDKIFFITGGPAARIFSSKDRGRSWTVVETPVVSGNPSSGIFSVACIGHENLVVWAVGPKGTVARLKTSVALIR